MCILYKSNMQINLVNICLFILGFVLISKIIEKIISEPVHKTIPMKSNIDNLIYKVQKHYNSDEAANMLAEIRKRLCTLINNL